MMLKKVSKCSMLHHPQRFLFLTDSLTLSKFVGMLCTGTTLETDNLPVSETKRSSRVSGNTNFHDIVDTSIFLDVGKVIRTKFQCFLRKIMIMMRCVKEYIHLSITVRPKFFISGVHLSRLQIELFQKKLKNLTSYI